jgi:hypothetical protein
MGKRRAESQTGSLTPNHQNSGIDAFPTSDLSVRHGVGKISTRSTTSVQTSSRSKSAVESYGGSKFRESRRDNFGTIPGFHFGSPRNLCHLDVGAAERRRVYYREYDGGILPRSGPWCVSWSKVPMACPNTQGCPKC